MQDSNRLVIGGEQHEYFTKSNRKKAWYCAYNYRFIDGTLFSCVRSTLDECRAARDEWLLVVRGKSYVPAASSLTVDGVISVIELCARERQTLKKRE